MLQNYFKSDMVLCLWEKSKKFIWIDRRIIEISLKPKQKLRLWFVENFSKTKCLLNNFNCLFFKCSKTFFESQILWNLNFKRKKLFFWSFSFVHNSQKKLHFFGFKVLSETFFKVEKLFKSYKTDFLKTCENLLTFMR